MSLTVSGDTAEVLLQLGHIKRRIQRLRVSFVIGERGSGEVGVGGMEADRTSDAAGNLQWNKRNRGLANRDVQKGRF